MIADGILPANDGQGYVLRRLIRRAARYGRLIGIDRPFINDVIPAVIELMGDPYAELGENRLTIEKIVEIEENGFGKTIRQGSELLDAEVKAALESAGKTLGGAVAFQLYDTFGFPLELTREICAEHGVSVDEEGFKTEMARQRKRARSSSKQIANNVIKGNVFNALANEFGATDFVGYEKSECNTKIRALVRDGRKVDALDEGEEGMVLLESSPFYAERGGQIGDTGLIKADGVLAVVKDSTHPFGELNMQTVTVTKGALRVGQGVLAQIDMDRHLAIARNHTATHILHAVLGKVLGGHVRQNGSLVSDRFLRFDYTHYEAPRREQLEEIETLTNAAILTDRPVTTVVTDLEAAKASGAKALFEEKYGQTVRVVSVGDFSSELCGGTHVPSSGTIGSLKIVGEESIGSGIRRITAVTGMTTVRLLQELSRTADELSTRLAVKRPLLIEKVKGMEEEIKALKRQIDEMSRAELAGSIDGLIAKKTLAGGAVNLYIGRVDGQDMDLLRESGDKFKDGDPKAVFVIFPRRPKTRCRSSACSAKKRRRKSSMPAGSSRNWPHWSAEAAADVRTWLRPAVGSRAKSTRRSPPPSISLQNLSELDDAPNYLPRRRNRENRRGSQRSPGHVCSGDCCLESGRPLAGRTGARLRALRHGLSARRAADPRRRNDRPFGAARAGRGEGDSAALSHGHREILGRTLQHLHRYELSARRQRVAPQTKTVRRQDRRRGDSAKLYGYERS